MDFSNYKFRCSSLGYLMVNPRSKSETISETTKAHLRDVFIAEAYGRSYDIITKFMDKGNYAEEDSLTLVTQNLGKLLTKNKESLENDFVKGTPDIILAEKVIDIKTCWDMRTYIAKDQVEHNYYWQLQGYMWLTGKQKADLIYTLVNTPEHLIVQEKSRRMFQTGYSEGTPEWAEEEERIDKWMTFDDVDPKLRMKVFSITRNDEDIAKLTQRIVDARNYLKTITLN